MKQGRKPRSKSPSKRARFNSRHSASESDATVAAASSLSGYVRSVRQVLGVGGLTEEYLEFIDVVDDLRQAVTAAKDDDTMAEKVISHLERAVSLLDGQPELIAGLRMFLPSHYYIDIQPDAVVIKVTISGFHDAQC